MTPFSIGGILVWLTAFSLYLATLCPTVYVGDAGELIAGAATLGIPHPPGYPVFCLFNKIMSVLVPIGSVAYRVNLGSALAATGAGWLVFYCVIRWAGETSAAVATATLAKEARSGWQSGLAVMAAMTLACSELFWGQAVEAEVYALTSCAVIGSVAVFSWWLSAPDRFGRLCVCAVLFGVAAAVHQLWLLMAPIFFFAAWRMAPRTTGSWVRWGVVGLCFACGVSVVLYLPLRSLAEPPINWGHPDTFERFFDHVRRRQYGRLSKIERSWPLVAAQVKFLSETFLSQFKWWWLPIIGVGGWTLHRVSGWINGVVAWGFFVMSLGLALLFNFPETASSYMAVSAFFASSYIMAAVWLGVGLLVIVQRVPRARTVVCVAALMTGPAWGFRHSNAVSNVAWHTVAHDYGVALLSSLPERSTIIASGDNAMFSMAYLQLVERRRPDITVYDDSGYIFPNIYGLDFLRRDTVSQEAHRLFMQKAVIRQSGGPVYYTLENTKHDLSGVSLSPAGLVQWARVAGERERLAQVESLEGQRALWRRYFIRAAHEPNMLRADYITRNLMAQYFYQLAGFFHEQGEKRTASAAYRRSDRIGYDNEWIQSNLGVILMNRGEHEEAVARCRRAVEINPQSGEAHLNLGAALDSYAEALKPSRPNVAGRFEQEARTAYERAIQLKPTYHTAFFNLGNTYMRQGRFREAIEQYQKALTHNPRSVESHINMGNAMDGYSDRVQDPAEKIKIKEGAMEEYRRALVLRPDSLEAHINLGTAYFNRGDRASARREYEEALRHDSRSVEAQFNLGNVHLVEGRGQEAVASYRRVIGLNASYIEAYFAMGVAYEKMGQRDQAVKAWEAGLKVDPRHQKILSKLGRSAK